MLTDLALKRLKSKDKSVVSQFEISSAIRFL